jgi:hypothetical protein
MNELFIANKVVQINLKPGILKNELFHQLVQRAREQAFILKIRQVGVKPGIPVLENEFRTYQPPNPGMVAHDLLDRLVCASSILELDINAVMFAASLTVV